MMDTEIERRYAQRDAQARRRTLQQRERRQGLRQDYPNLTN